METKTKLNPCAELRNVLTDERTPRPNDRTPEDEGCQKDSVTIIVWHFIVQGVALGLNKGSKTGLTFLRSCDFSK